MGACSLLFVLAQCAMLTRAEWLFEFPDAPPRWTSKLLGLPTWIVPIEGYHEDTFDATTLFSVVAMCVSAIPAVWCTWKYTNETRRLPPLFNLCLLGYMVATVAASTSFLVMNAGKVWASFGVFHNLLEIALLVVLLVQRNVIPYFYFVPACFAYIMSTMFMVILLPWPLDALFFKFQGLATDWALFFYLYLLYQSNATHHRLTKIATAVAVTDRNGKKEIQVQPPVHFHIGIIATAAVLHAVGNSLVTFSNHFTMWVIFQFMYAISFPMYAYYSIVEPDTSRMVWFQTTTTKDIALLIASVVTAGGCIAIGIVNSGALNK